MTDLRFTIEIRGFKAGSTGPFSFNQINTDRLKQNVQMLLATDGSDGAVVVTQEPPPDLEG